MSDAPSPPVGTIGWCDLTVDDLKASLARCRDEDGEVVTGPRSAGGGRYAVIRDPAGAVLGLFAED